jgi:hypothetical protein
MVVCHSSLFFTAVIAAAEIAIGTATAFAAAFVLIAIGCFYSSYLDILIH